MKRGDKPGCFRVLPGKPCLKLLPEFLHVGVGNKGVRAKLAKQEALPYFNCLILVVVPGLATANLHVPYSLLLWLAKGLPDGRLLVGILLWFIVETNHEGEYLLRHVGVQHDVGATSRERFNGSDILLKGVQPVRLIRGVNFAPHWPGRIAVAGKHPGK